MKRIKRKILNYLLRKLFNTVTENEVLGYHKGKLYFNGKMLVESDAKQLIVEAKAIQEMLLWEYLTKNMKWLSNKKMYYDSSCDNDMLAGKMMLYAIDLIEKKVKNLPKTKLDYK